MKRLKQLRSLCACASIAGAAFHATPVMSAYPEYPVKIVVGFPPGQATDVIARLLGNKLAETYKAGTFLVENRPGAAGIVGTKLVANAPPDGQTLLMASSATLAINPSLYSKLPYDPVKNFTPVTLVATVPLYLVVHPSVPAKNVAELVALARKQPGKIDYGSGGSGVTNHLAMEMFKVATGTNLAHIPYKGGPAAVTDLLAGRLSVMFETGPAVLQYIKAGKLRALAVSSAKRASASPELPTIAESGYPGFEAVPWVGLMAPAGTPEPIVESLAKESSRILHSPEFASKLTAIGADPVGSTPAEFAAYLRKEMDRWGKAVKASGALVD
ncbi:BUG/TctC family periplasmic protein (plasmid) [Cupriavidus necator H850]|uniref:Bug family tripartite tricarboxylate transporter substrate binding protein n=1 Tax=Cupriavidus necator TaxID=106590 RepID=UPI00129ECF21|nr:tripartite tricarboxylate transporter substrate binding protein [Cupriavidus necator]KAI3610254.1 BUG/TctC family periplasmic protein [Cupriavidus necator H850]